MSLTYSECVKLATFQERLRYLRVTAPVAQETFAEHRYLNQALYHCADWDDIRRDIIVRDEGCDLGIPGLEINGPIYVHHINPITLEDIYNRSPILFDPDNLICCSKATHDAIHYGADITCEQLYSSLTPRRPNDTCPWKA